MKDNSEKVKKTLVALDRLFKARLRALGYGLPVAEINVEIETLMGALRMLEGK